MLSDTAIRRAELVALDIRDLDLERRQLVVRSGKGQKRRVVPFTDELASDLRIYLDRRTAGPLFLSQRRTALSVRQLNRIVKRVGELAGVRHPNPDSDGAITPHLFRHTFARHWKQAGGDIESLRNILGHAHATTTIDLYGSLSMDDIQTTYDRLRGQHLDDEIS
jgi:integrase/recombinase XerD